MRNVSLTVPAGGSVVLTGTSGIGKSLLIEILLRFRNYEGSITVGGVEIRDLPKDALTRYDRRGAATSASVQRYHSR